MPTLAEASAQRVDRALFEEIDKRIDLLLAGASAPTAAPHFARVTANPRSMGYLRFLLRYYAKQPHPWTKCFPPGTPVDCPRDHERYPDGVPISELKPGDLVWSFNTEAYVFELKPVVWSSMVRRKAQLAMLTLDDGSQIKATPDHKFMRRDATWIELQDLRTGDSLMPLYRDYLPMVRRKPDSLSWAPEHHLVAESQWTEDERNGKHVHHRDARRCNTTPSNFELLTNSEHTTLHHRTVRELMAAAGIVRECRGCGERFEPTKRVQRYCGECPESASYVRLKVGKPTACLTCGVEFLRNAATHDYCSAECREHKKGRPRCQECGIILSGKGRSVWCLEHAPKVTKDPMDQERLCANCGSEFVPHSGVQRHCSATCRRQYSARKPENCTNFNHKVVSVVLLDEREDVWDIEVADNHSFVVRGVVAHNCVSDNTKRFGPEQTKALCDVVKDLVRQNTHWRHGAPRGPHPGHPDVGAPGVAIAEADKWASPAWDGHHLSDDAPKCIVEALDREFGEVDHFALGLGDAVEALSELRRRLPTAQRVHRVLLGLDAPPDLTLQEAA